MSDTPAPQAAHAPTSARRGSPTSHAEVDTRPGAAPLSMSNRAKMQVLLAVLLGLLLAALDETIVGTALPRIITDLKGNELYTWVVTIYLLTSTITVPFYGKLSDLFGRKPLLMIGIGLFLLGSALSGLSQNMPMLIAFRGVQGLGAGALFPISLAVIGDLFSPQERGKYQGLFGAVFGLSALIGPAIGGLLTDYIGWHAIFYVNIPVGLVSLAVIARVLPTIRRPDATRNLDILGALVFIAAIAPILIGLTNAQTSDWGTPQVGGLIGVGLVFTAIFAIVEWKAKEPIVPLDLFRNRTYAASIVATFLAAFGFFAAIIFLPRYFQVVLGRSATMSGYEMFPLLLGVIVGSILAGQMVARTGRYKVIILAGLVLLSIGSFFMTNLHSDTDPWILRAWMVIAGFGIGPTLAVFTIVVQNAIPFDKLGVGTSNLTFFRQIGGTVGLAIAGTYFASQIRSNIPGELLNAGVPQPVVTAFSGQGFDLNELGAGLNLADSIAKAVPAQLQPLVPAIVKGIYEAMSTSIGSIFWISLAASLAALAASLLIHEVPLRDRVHAVDHGPRAVRPSADRLAEASADAIEAPADTAPEASEG